MKQLDKKIFSALFFSIFSAVMGVGIVVPLLPVYAETLGASGLYIGFIFSVFSLSRTILLPVFGHLSDKTGRKPYITAGLLGYAVVSLAFMYTDTIRGLIGVRFFQGIASAMIMPVAQAYIGDITPKDREGFTMGLFNLSVFGSLSLGPIAGGLLKDSWGMDAAFVGMGVLSLIGFLLALLCLPPRKEEYAVRRGSRPTPWPALLRDRSLHGLFIFRCVYVFCIGTLWCFLPILATGMGLSGTRTGILVTLGVLVSGLLQVPMGMLADSANKRRMAVTGGLIVAVAIFSFQWASGFWTLFAASIVFGIGGGIAMPPMMAMAVIKGDSAGAMGATMSLITMAHSTGMFFGALLAGLAMDFFSLRQSFPLAGIIMLSGTALFAIFTGKMTGKTITPDMP
jgi:MFS transporter, DHA1 family, multidrug resistance protein